MRRVGWPVLLATASLSLAPAVALASRAPSHSERRSIVAAIQRMKALGNPRIYLVKSIRISTRGPYDGRAQCHGTALPTKDSS